MESWYGATGGTGVSGKGTGQHVAEAVVKGTGQHLPCIWNIWHVARALGGKRYGATSGGKRAVGAKERGNMWKQRVKTTGGKRYGAIMAEHGQDMEVRGKTSGHLEALERCGATFVSDRR